jgi:hypothetical protein
MRHSRPLLVAASLGICAAARAVYAPIPVQEQGKDLTISLETGISYNTNIFGAASDDIASTVFEEQAKLSYNASLTDTTFASAHFTPTVDYFTNRPGTKLLYSQEVDGRIAHSFSPTSALDVTDTFNYNQNPEALLNGTQTPINTDQTLLSDEFDGRFSFAPTEKLGLVIKERTTYFDYTDAILGNELNRFENTYGLEGDFSMLPDFKLAGEYRHEDVDYENNPGENDKHTDFLMVGFDYQAGPKLSASVRVGGEHAHRDGLSDETTPYAEVSAKYDYAKGSFVSIGYTYSLEETSDPIHFSDERVNRMFINLQHAFTSLIVGSASFDYEPAVLVGRPPQVDIDEDSTHAGVALSYLPTKNCTVSATYDYDFVDSGLSYRGLNRSRVGVSATFVF